MKWFKHQSEARNDEKIARLEDKAGLEGYGFYFKMLEIVAQIIDSTDRHEVTYSLTRWGRQANISTKKFVYLSQCCADVGLMLVQRCNDDMTIKMPNLLKYRDNHTKNLQVTVKQDLEEDKEEEIEKEEDKNKAKSADLSAVEIMPIPDFINARLWNDFIDVRKGLKAKNTLPAINALINQLQKLKDAGHDPSEVVRTSIRSSWKDLYPLKTSSIGQRAASREAGRQIAAQSIFKPANTRHLQGDSITTIEAENEQNKLTA